MTAPHVCAVSGVWAPTSRQVRTRHSDRMKKTTKKPQQQPADSRKRLRELDDKALGTVSGGGGVNPLYQA